MRPMLAGLGWGGGAVAVLVGDKGENISNVFIGDTFGATRTDAALACCSP